MWSLFLAACGLTGALPSSGGKATDSATADDPPVRPSSFQSRSPDARLYSSSGLNLQSVSDVEPAGDVDGDGALDLDVEGDYGHRAYVVPGPYVGDVDVDGLLVEVSPAGDVVRQSTWGAAWPVGDVDGDGADDLVVVTEGYDSEGDEGGERNVVDVLEVWSRPTSADRTSLLSVTAGAYDRLDGAFRAHVDDGGDVMLALGGWVDVGPDETLALPVGLSGALTYDQAAAAAVIDVQGSVADAADVDGDGLDDLILSADWESGGETGDRLAVLLAPFSSSVSVLDADFQIDDAGVYGVWLAYPDGDGHVDLLDADVVSGEGQVRRWEGPLGDRGAGAWDDVLLADGRPGFEVSFATGGDVDGDGKDDLVVGQSTTASYSGAVTLVSGADFAGTVQLEDVAGWRYVGRPGEHVGAYLGLGDVDGNGVAEIWATSTDLGSRNRTGSAILFWYQ